MFVTKTTIRPRARAAGWRRWAGGREARGGGAGRGGCAGGAWWAAGRVAHAALLRYYLDRSDLRDVVQEAGQMEVPRIEKNIRAILGAALLAPLVGLLGTMVGMLDTVQKVSEHGGFSDPAELSR